MPRHQRGAVIAVPCLQGVTERKLGQSNRSRLQGQQPGQRTQVRFLQPVGMQVSWYAMGPDGKPMYSPTPIEALERLDHLTRHGPSDHAFGWESLTDMRAAAERRCA